MRNGLMMSIILHKRGVFRTVYTLFKLYALEPSLTKEEAAIKRAQLDWQSIIITSFLLYKKSKRSISRVSSLRPWILMSSHQSKMKVLAMVTHRQSQARISRSGIITRPWRKPLMLTSLFRKPKIWNSVRVCQSFRTPPWFTLCLQKGTPKFISRASLQAPFIHFCAKFPSMATSHPLFKSIHRLSSGVVAISKETFTMQGRALVSESTGTNSPTGWSVTTRVEHAHTLVRIER